MKRVEFFFDLSSPYSYIAATQLPALVERTGAEVAWRPMVLFAVFKSSGNDMPARVPHKARWMGQDLQRWADHYGIPWKMSSHFPLNTVKAMRLILVDDAKAGAVALAAFRAMWAEDRDITQEAELRRIAELGGLDPTTALQKIEEPAIKDRLRANTDEAITRGAFGAPTMLVGDELFWGNDRLQFVEQALERIALRAK
ncbi:MAG: disulfide bond formation protein DsbA [Myxococcales bacterium]|nr:disulfide bond formation protein DsbA [Myxococcales bacterium]